jgi:hypothetical protein
MSNLQRSSTRKRPGQAIFSVGFRPGLRRNPTTHSRDPTEIIGIRWDPTGHS